MTKILRITGIIPAVLMTVFVFVLPAAFGSSSSGEIEEFLKSSGAIEEFKKAKGSKAAKSPSQISPLVKEAEDFALYLNPAPKPKRRTKSTKKYKPKAAPRPAGPVTSQFKLLGTSFYVSDPNMSLALIDQPAKGFRWVRQSSKVGHLVIEEVKDGLVVIRDGKRTYELVAVRKPRKSLVRGKGASLDETGSKPVLPDKAAAGTVSSKPKSIEPSASSAEEVAMQEELMEDIMKKMEAMFGSGSGKPEESSEDDAIMKEVLTSLETMRMSSEESKKLDHLGRELKGNRQYPNRVRSRITRSRTKGSSKIEAGSSEPNSPKKK